MFSGPAFILFHTIISIAAMIPGAAVMAMFLRNRTPGGWTAAFILLAIATSVTGFMLPLTGLTPPVITGIAAMAALSPAILAQYAFRFAGAWRGAYVIGMTLNVYLLWFVLITQIFLKVPLVHALAPNAPEQPEPPFAIAQGVLLLVFLWLGWLSWRRFRPPPAPAGITAAPAT